jgi:LPS-assembly protein
MMRGLLRIAVSAALLLALAATAHAQAPSRSDFNTSVQKFRSKSGEPVLITADEVSYDQELGTIIARGKVEIVQGKRILTANSVSYNQKTDTVSASGNITLLEPSGDVIFAEYVELTDEFKNGVVKQLRILLKDESRFAANEAIRRDANRTIMKQAVYSPCKPCKDDPSKPPLWQLKAEKIVHDQEEQEITYQNAFLELFGVPVAYTPYFSHPDPTVYRRTGFLAPTFGSDGNLGAFIQMPFFLVLDDDKDMTISPIYTVDEGLVFHGEYRQRFTHGEFRLAGSGTSADRSEGDPSNPQTKEDQFRGHIEAFARYDINQTWRAGMDVVRATDRSYLRRFNFFGIGGNTLRQHGFIEGFRQRNYAGLNLYAFQDLRTSTERQDEQVYVAPMMDYSHIGESDRLGGRFSLDASFRHLGFVTTLNASFKADLYYSDQTDDARVNTGVSDGLASRLLPRFRADWRYPFSRSGEDTTQLVEPIVGIVATRNGGNTLNIPNEDSGVFEEDDTNLLSVDRLPGGDRVESGQRLFYGVKFGLFGRSVGSNSAFIGQTFRISRDDELDNNHDINRGLSDIVGRVDIRPHEYVDLLYRFRFDYQNLDSKRNEFSFAVGPKAFKFNGDYIFVGTDTGTGLDEVREEFRGGISSQITQYWSIRGSTSRDLTRGGGSLSHTMSLRYEDECFVFDVTGTRSFFRDADIQPSDSLLFKLIFKHLGEVSTSAG